MAYARGTSVSVAKSRAEIEHDLARAGCTEFSHGYSTDRGAAAIEFVVQDRRVRFVMALPKKDAFAQRRVRSRWVQNSPEEQERRWEQACRERWRALALLVKSKLAAVESGIATFESEFLAHIVIPREGGGTTTIGAQVIPQIAEVMNGRPLPPLLPPAPGG